MRQLLPAHRTQDGLVWERTLFDLSEPLGVNAISWHHLLAFYCRLLDFLAAVETVNHSVLGWSSISQAE